MAAKQPPQDNEPAVVSPSNTEKSDEVLTGRESLENYDSLHAPISNDSEKVINASGSDSLEKGSTGDVPKLETTDKSPPLFRLMHRFNPYILLMVLLLVIAGGIIVAGLTYNKQHQSPSTPSHTLTQAELDQFKGSDAEIGDPKQLLSIKSNATFAGTVLIRQDLNVAGGLKVGSALSLPSLVVGGSSTFSQVQVNKLTVSGDATVTGNLNVEKDVNVSGNFQVSGKFSANTLTVNSLQIAKDLLLSQHLDPNGNTPARSNDGSIGSGGTASNSGTDTAGTVTINIGSGPSAGCFTTITFVQKFSATPHVVISPASAGAAGLQYYATRTNTGFSICSANAPSAGANLVYDYIVVD